MLDLIEAADVARDAADIQAFLPQRRHCFVHILLLARTDHDRRPLLRKPSCDAQPDACVITPGVRV